MRRSVSILRNEAGKGALRGMDRMNWAYWNPVKIRFGSGRLDEVAASGVRGVRVLRAILDERGDDYVPPASGLEGRFAEIVSDASLPPMDRQIDLGDDAWRGRVDFHDRELRLIVEVDSEKYHTALSDVEADRLREEGLRRAGFTVVRVSDFQVFQRPWEVIASVRSARSKARRRPAA